jgi:PAS domain S-box-containing protein
MVAVVLLAEDDPDHQRLLADLIRRLGHDVTVADDGWSALISANRRRPDLVVTDVDMPEMNGLQLCRALREDVLLADVPIVLVTALLLPGDPQLAASGAIAVVRKPFDLRELSTILAQHLDNLPSQSPRETSATVAPRVDPAFVETMMHSVNAGMATCDTAGRLTSFNGFLRDFFGEDSSAVPVKEWAERFNLRHHDGSPVQTSDLPMLRALHGETVEHAGQLAVDQRGRNRWLTINARPVRDSHDTIIGAVAAVHDVTAEYRSRIYQTCKNEILKALAESPNVTAAGDTVVRIIAISLGWPYVRLWMLDPVVDRLRPAATYTAEHEPAVPLPTSLARGHGLPGSCWQRGEPIWVADIRAADSPVLPEVVAATSYRAAGAIPVRSGDQINGVLTFFSYDQQEPEPGLGLLLSGIASSVGAYRQQRRADELARNLAATTDEYIALVGHELRTPLASITSYAQLIAESPDLTDDLRQLVEVVDRNSQRLSQLIEQLLDLAALEAGHAALSVEDVDLTDVVADSAALARPVALSRRITIGTRAPHPLTVAGDRARLTQMMHGLLDNAIKFSPDGSTVDVTATGDDDAVTLTVSDTGIGLPADEQPQLFRRLFRGNNARHRGIPGNGLGLALCRAVVEKHHGTITLAPHQPSGTTVTIRLPRLHD